MGLSVLFSNMHNYKSKQVFPAHVLHANTNQPVLEHMKYLFLYLYNVSLFLPLTNSYKGR